MIKRDKRISELERYIYCDCRIVLLHVIGNNYTKFAAEYGININSITNFVKWSYADYLAYSSDKVHRYLSIDNCIRILELSGYEIRLSLVLKNDGENEV